MRFFDVGVEGYLGAIFFAASFMWTGFIFLIEFFYLLGLCLLLGLSALIQLCPYVTDSLGQFCHFLLHASHFLLKKLMHFDDSLKKLG
jgi:hypothetical protein